MNWGLEKEARRRLLIIAFAALLNSTFAVGVEGILLPLWVTKDLGMTPAEWAKLRSLRWTGVLVGVIILGALSDRFGQRRIGALSMFGAAIALVIMEIKPEVGLWVAMPVFGAMVSTSYVNLNVLTQQVSKKRQGLINSVYRSMGAMAAIMAPLIATYLAAVMGGYRTVLLVFAAMLTAAGFVLLQYPAEKNPPLGELRGEVKRLWKGYNTALKQRRLMRVIHLSQIWSNTLAGIGAFAAIYFTLHLHKSDRYFGLLSSISGILTFAVTAGVAVLLDRVSLRKMSVVVMVSASLCSILMGLGDSPVLAAIGYVLFGPVGFLSIAPISMWISREAGESSQAAAFSVHKVLTAVYVAIAMAILGFLENRIGIRPIFLYGGILGLLFGLLILRLPEPPETSL